MKIAYIILAHTDPSHICRLANKLIEFPWAEVFIHVDKKSDINQYLEIDSYKPSIHFVEDRVEVYWADFSSVVATVNAFKYAFKHGYYDRFVILQGLDYPIMSNQYIYDYFNQYHSVEFIKSMNGMDHAHKYCFIWFMGNYGRLHKLWNYFNRFLQKMNMMIKFKKPFVTDGSNKYDIYQGWAHIALTGNCVKYLINFYDAHPKFNKYFTTVFAPDESYFHTIIYNSVFKINTVDGKSIEYKDINSLLNVTYFEYPDRVTLFKDKSDFKKLLDTNLLFFRKANSESKELLDYIDTYHKKANK